MILASDIIRFGVNCSKLLVPLFCEKWMNFEAKITKGHENGRLWDICEKFLVGDQSGRPNGDYKSRDLYIKFDWLILLRGYKGKNKGN